MLSKIAIIFLATFMIGVISSVSGEDDLCVYDDCEDYMYDTDSIPNGDFLSIVSTHNTNDEIPHHPDEYELLKPTKVNGILHYVLGARTRNDRLVAQGGQNQSWPSPHNTQIQLTYPPQGYGAAVTYVAIVVNQTSNLGKAYVVKGGINQHVISVVVEAYNTLVFNVFAYVYGV